MISSIPIIQFPHQHYLPTFPSLPTTHPPLNPFYNRNIMQPNPTPKSPSSFLDQMLSSYRDKNPHQLIHLFTNLINQQYPFPSGSWRQPYNFPDCAGMDSLAPLFLNMLETLKAWMSKRTESPQGIFTGFKIYVGMLDLCLKYVQAKKNEPDFWFLPVIKSIIRKSKRVLMEAKQAGDQLNRPTDKLAETLFHQLREFKSSRDIEESTKKKITLLIDNLQVSIFFSTHDYNKAERALDLIRRNHKYYSPAELNHFNFQYGKVCLIAGRFLQAQAYLQKTLIYRPSQQKLVMRYLIPCKIFLGRMCMNPDYPQYLPLIQGIIRGDFRIFQKAIQRYQKLWIKRGIYLVMQRMRLLVWRNLIKRIVRIADSTQIEFTDIVKGVRLMGGEETIDECMCVISNLIFQGFIKGYIYYSETKRTLAVKKTATGEKNSAAFPRLAKVFEDKAEAERLAKEAVLGRRGGGGGME